MREIGANYDGKGETSVNMTPFENRIYLASPTMHGEELTYITEAYTTNWMSTIGENINTIEREIGAGLGGQYAVALASGTSALHLAMKLAGVKAGDTVFCTDLTFAATVNPIVYEGATPVFIDSERDTWNMDAAALEKAFALYPDTKVVVAVDLYGVPAKYDELRAVCDAHGATLIEDAAEAYGASYRGKPTGTFGTYNVISFNGNKIITGSTGGMLLTHDEQAATTARKWSTQSRENAPWYQHEDLGYNYRMSNVVAGVVRGQLPYLAEHIAKKRAIYDRYAAGFADLPIRMNPYTEDMQPSFWLSCMTIDEDALCEQTRTATTASYNKTAGKTCPTEILEKLEACNVEGRPIWKPMHMQPIYAENPFVSCEDGDGVGGDIFARGLCLPSDIKMTEEEQDAVIAIIRSCFER